MAFMPCRPDLKRPFSRRMRSVSAWSSAWCAIISDLMLWPLHALPNAWYRSARASVSNRVLDSRSRPLGQLRGIMVDGMSTVFVQSRVQSTEGIH